jgi:hypothetical protein
MHMDLGFEGFANYYPCKKVYIPYKRKKPKKGENNELSRRKKRTNKALAAKRVIVEHSIGGTKRQHIIANRIRIKSMTFLNAVILTCAGLWNLLIK